MNSNKKSEPPPIDGSLTSILRLVFELLWVLVCFVPILLYTIYKKIFPGDGKDIRNKVVLVTGTANGLGKELALQFARQGCRVCCVDINETNNEKTVRQIATETGDGKIAKGYVCDVSNTASVKKLTEDVLKDFTKVDILVNNAGIIYSNNILTGDEENIQRVIDVNLMSAYWMTRSFLPHMKKRKEGHIVYMNSMASITAVGGGIVYSISKFALKGLAWALEDFVRKDPECSNIKITSVHPYFIGTDNWYSQNIFKTRIKVMTTTDAARQVITGIRREYPNFQVPGYDTGFWVTSLLRYLPFRTYYMLRDVMHSDLASPTEGDKAFKNIPKKAVK